jgi:hypothetical protein
MKDALSLAGNRMDKDAIRNIYTVLQTELQADAQELWGCLNAPYNF